MVYSSLGKKSVSMVLAMAFAISGCMPTDVASTRQGMANATGAAGTTAGAGGGTTLPNTATAILPKVEIRHLIEPNLSTVASYNPGTGYAGGGSYVRKLTLPKNFAGRLYLAGINIGTLADRHVKVRFKFGVGREPVTISAVVTQAPGITPQTSIQVLVMDMRSEPFRNVRLPYDLFDYNEYTASQTPVQDNRDTGLYCRGLRIEDDPSFTGVGECDGAQPDEECLYAYAKVMDQGLVKQVLSGSSTIYVPTVPSLPQVKSVSGLNYYMDYLAQTLKKPLADDASGPFIFSQLAVPLNSTDATNITFAGSPIDWTGKSINGTTYHYRGPYRIVNKPEWHFKFADPVGAKKLFRDYILYGGPDAAVPGYAGATSGGATAIGGACTTDASCSTGYCNPSTFTCAATTSLGGSCSTDVSCSSRYCDPSSLTCQKPKVFYESYMFPLATQLSLSTGVAHLASNNWADPRSETSLSVPGKTQWMDGANARAMSKNTDLEHIGSCNVAATIEIIAKDNNGTDYVVALTDEVKLQLVRPIQHYTDNGNDVLYTNFKTCSSNSTCGSNECCFNNRCWDETLVSQCYDSSSTQGNKQVGDTCLTDLECTSLCCNRTSGLCAPHNTLTSTPVLCSKPIGDFCIAKEWCQKTPVIKCLVVKTGTDSLGNTTCRQQCYTTLEYGDCKAGVCVAPFQDVIPVFDPDDPAACDNAVTAPNF